MSVLRISGIASGMDTESMVRDLMKAERMRLDKYTQSKQLNQWRQEQYNNANKDFANFIIDMRKELELTTNTSTGLTLSNSTSNLSWVKKASSSDEDVFTAKATSGAMGGTHKLKVISLAEGVNIASKDPVKTEADENATSLTLLKDMGVDFSSGAKTLSFEIKVDEEVKTVDINYDGTDTIGDLVKKINNATTADGKSSLGLQASFDNSSGRLFLSTKETGADAQIKVSSDEGGLLTGENNKFKIDTANDLSTGIKGTDAEIEFNGAQGLKYSSNTITINGIQIDLKSTSANPNADEFILRVDTDVDSVYDKINTFVDKYNELIDKMNGITSQKRYRDYPPLTDEQKEAMTEDQIKKWEEMAQSGLLKNDESITRTMDSMRSGLYREVEGVEGKFGGITAIGIATSDWKDRGKLTIDEAKLKKAIIEDVDGVINLLFKQSSITGSDLTPEERETKRNESGLITRVFDDIVVGMKDIITKSGTGDNSNLYRNVQSNILIDFVTDMGSISNLDEKLIDVEKSIMREESNLEMKENSYWRKFTAMEKALQQMNSQSAWIMQQFGGGQ